MLYDVIHVGGQLNEVDERPGAAARDSDLEEDSDDQPEGESQQVPFIRVHAQEPAHQAVSINNDSDDGAQPGGGRRSLRIDKKLLQ